MRGAATGRHRHLGQHGHPGRLFATLSRWRHALSSYIVGDLYVQSTIENRARASAPTAAVASRPLHFVVTVTYLHLRHNAPNTGFGGFIALASVQRTLSVPRTLLDSVQCSRLDDNFGFRNDPAYGAYVFGSHDSTATRADNDFLHNRC